MYSNNSSQKVVTVDKQAFKHAAEQTIDADGVPVVDEKPIFKPGVEQATQAKVDANHPDAGVDGLSLAAEEREIARKAEKARTRARWDRRQTADREARTRQVVAEGSRRRRETFAERRAAVDPWTDPARSDPRESLAQEELAQVNETARRIATNRTGWTAAAVSRRLATQVANGQDLSTATVRVAEEVRTAPGTVIPIDAVGDVSRSTVSIAGEWVEDWEPTSPAISQVGLLADDTGQIKVTVWVKSNQPRIDEGERVRIASAKTSWYEGRVSVALTRRSQLGFPERNRWWER
ncbi:DNA-binding protein [Halorubrum sp. SD626R]|uniref:DNA-binding protein n=1 Tax=Halorubrum sp. SD626R TaxID=1419722 RepID=UPI000A692BAA|nr:DNA-binding protein [Halorubrum sp. SD626R]TKX82298.1 DNA-binding protein [Halorubrum sp. SD626R]